MFIAHSDLGRRLRVLFGLLLLLLCFALHEEPLVLKAHIAAHRYCRKLSIRNSACVLEAESGQCADSIVIIMGWDGRRNKR